MSDTKPTIEEQIACMSDIQSFGNDMRLSILASLKELAAIKSQPVPVEPVAWCREWEGDSSDLNHIIVEFDKSELDEPLERWTPLYTVPVAPSHEVLDELNKLHKLYAAPALTQQERDAERERGDQWETTATNLLARAEKAEEALKVAQQERDDAVTQLKKWKEDGEHLFCQTCDSCGTDECCPPSQCWQTRAEKAEASNKRLVEFLKEAQKTVNDMRSEHKMHGHITDASAHWAIKIEPELLREVGK